MEEPDLGYGYEADLHLPLRAGYENSPSLVTSYLELLESTVSILQLEKPLSINCIWAFQLLVVSYC